MEGEGGIGIGSCVAVVEIGSAEMVVGDESCGAVSEEEMGEKTERAERVEGV